MAAIGGRDTSIFLLRALSKILYCKSKSYFTICILYEFRANNVHKSTENPILIHYCVFFPQEN